MEYTPLYEKAIKQNQNKPMEITKLLDGWDERRRDVGFKGLQTEVSIGVT